MWLRYAPAPIPANFPAVVATVGDSAVLQSARDELIRGIRGMTGRVLRIESGTPKEPAIELRVEPGLPADAYRINTNSNGSRLLVAASNDRGVLYGVFDLLRMVALGGGGALSMLHEPDVPHSAIRWVNQWDNLDGSIERGYGGRSIFWEGGHARADLGRVRDYGRMLASLGINGCSINNVNADRRVLTPEWIPDIVRIADAFRPWGVQVVLAIDFASPKTIGGLDTFDPLDAKVVAWWKAKVDELYRAVPDLAGFVLKADSEGRVGPAAYKRTHADAANSIARALRPHGGLLLYRGFVYNNRMDWRNLKNDRARAAVDNFQPLDGQFDDNVIVQIKHGPIDFQVREPASPLFGALEKTAMAIELQITQEYFGQARHMVFLPTMWKEVLDFDLHAGAGVSAAKTPVKALAAGRTFHRPSGGFVGVANVGLDENWTGHPFSQANLYGFGRLAWNPDLTAREITTEWARLTFGNDPKVVETIVAMQLSSWRTYENYTGPLGLQTLTAIVGDHYGVSVESSERNGWGQWHRADDKGVGMDRTAATGTGFIAQYRPEVARVYESVETCPDDLLLFMHHVPYTHVLHSGKTVIQFIYDSHYDGAAAVEQYVRDWRSLDGRVDETRFQHVLKRLEYQAGQAQVWRDAVSNWFHRASGIADAQGRVGNHPHRVEAEAMELEGYRVHDVIPWEGASGGKAVECAAERCAARYRFDGTAGWYTLRVQYFDQSNGESRFRVFVANQLMDEWVANDRLPTRRVDSSSSSRRTVGVVALRPGDEIRIEGVPEWAEVAALDYVEIIPADK
jgi:alpha-glucuronidase